jgi:hypothetical protein
LDVRTQIKQAFMYAKNVLCRRVDVVDNLTSTSTDLPLSANMGKALKDSLLDLTYPVGSIYMSVNNTNPSLLFGGIWVEWGSGQVPVGVKSDDTDFSTSEKTGGSKYLQAHTHSVSVSGSAASGGAHTHSVSGSAASNGAHTHSVSGSAASSGAHTHNVKLNYEKNLTSGSGSNTHINYKGSLLGGAHANAAQSAGGHTHTVTGTAANAGAHTHSTSGTAASAGAHTHTVTASGTAASSGDGSAGNLQPYITCYMWKRTE